MEFSKIELFNYLNEALCTPRCCIFGSDVPPITKADFDLRWEDIALTPCENDKGEYVKGLIAKRYGVSPDMVLITSGSTSAAFLTIASVLETPGSAIIEKPIYSPLHDALNVFTHDVRPLPRWYEDDWDLDLDALNQIWDSSVRIIVLTRPNNPTGANTSDAQIKVLADYAARSGGYVLVDEVFREFDFDAPPGCSAAVAPNVITVCSFTKTFGFGSQRFGWFIGPKNIMDRVGQISGYLSVAGHLPVVGIMARAFEEIEKLRARSRKYVETGRAIFEDWLSTRDDIGCFLPRSGPYAFPVIKEESDSWDVAERLLKEHNTLVVPGRFFGYPPAIRVGYGGEADNLREGLDALSKVLDGKRA